ncbi:MAG: ribonuclease P protein component [Paracoccaceae bacterium]|nr:ribonuclease P protein component [Paracoccaceae bacterium]
MTPPEAPETGTKASARDRPPAVSVCPDHAGRAPVIHVMKIRADFLRCARAGRQGTAGMMVQARQRRADEPVSGIRVGFTCTKKVGNAVARNRAKRRLREVARMVLPDHGRDGWDYVLIGREGATAARPFEDLKRDLISALKKLHQNRT